VVSAADLEGSLRRRARGHAQHVHPPGPHLHDEQHIQLAADPALRPAALAGPIAGEFGVHVHPRSIERALARRREHPKSR
jgi:hypothetical protein